MPPVQSNVAVTSAPPPELASPDPGPSLPASASHPRRQTGGGWLGLRLAVAAVLAVLVLTGGTLPRELRIRQMAAPYAFHLVDWHVARLSERWTRIAAGLLGRRAAIDAGGRAATAAYFSAPAAEREALRPRAEDAIERGLMAVLADAGVGLDVPFARDGRLVFPPPSFTFVSPPRVLVVSRRDRIATVQTELLRPGVSEREAAVLESGIDGEEIVSLVIPTGGLATYPAMVLQATRPADALNAVAHEWAHGYLFFSPLGVRYWSSEEARAINETTADVVGRELGRDLARVLDLEGAAPPVRPDVARGPDRDFRALVRATRVEVDQLLAAGKVDEAEALMNARRDELAALGYSLRKLNQAYFAFYGSYGDAAAGASPIPGRLQRLRARSTSFAGFLLRVGQLTSAADLARAVGDG